MSDIKKTSESQSMNLLEFAANGFVESVDVNFDGKATTDIAQVLLSTVYIINLISLF